jgi:DNA-binding NtrC family response regulator
VRILCSRPAFRGFPDLKAVPLKEEISALLLHQPTESQRPLKQALQGRSIKVHWQRYCREALPLLREADPPHRIFTEALLPDGRWRDVVKMALEALKPLKVIVLSRLIDVRLYVETMARGAFDFIVPPITRNELAHVLARGRERFESGANAGPSRRPYRRGRLR